MSIIRYRFKADKNFESVKIDGMNCSLGELKRLIASKSSRTGIYHPKDDYDLSISNANTHEEYKDNSDLIPRNASVIVARRIRGTFDTITPSTNQKPVVSSDDIVKDILLPAIFNQHQPSSNSNAPSSSSMVETNAIPLEKLTESSSNVSSKEMSEDEMIKKIQMDSHARYVTTQPSYRTNLFVCHNCKQPGHIKSQCPSLLHSSNSNTSGNSSNISTGGDGTPSTNSGSIRPSAPHSSHIVTRHAPYQMSYHHRGNRSHRGAGHPRGEPLPKKTTGIPRDRLIPVPKHIPGALRDQTGASVVPRQMAELYVERIEKKADALAQIARQTEEKNVSSSIPSSSKPTEEDLIPNDLLCPLCKRIYTDAVITPCCNLSFCDECIRTALIESPEHECPVCHCQRVAIDQINPNLFLRNHIKRWHERQNQSPYSQMSVPQQTPQTLDQDSDTNTNLSNPNEIDEFDAAILPTSSQPLIKTAPIVIKMQPHGKSQSPQPPILSTRPADMTFEDEKTSDADQITSSQKDNITNEETTDTFPSSTTSETEKAEPETPPIPTQLVNPMYTSPSPSTNMPPTNPVVPHYYPAPQHHNVIYPHHLPPAAANGLYPMQPNYYPPAMGVRYPPSNIHHYPQYAPVPQVLHHHHHVPPPPGPPAIIPSPHMQPNGYNMPTFHPHTNAPFTSTSTFIAHHQTATTQPVSNALSEDEFYNNQRYFQRLHRSPSRRRSRSSSYSSYSSSDSRSSSRSRYNRRRRSSRSRSRHRVKSPIRDNRRQRRSSSYRNRRRPLPPPPPPPQIESKDKYSSKYRRSPPRPSRDHERRRSPRPPPTVQQSTQRTIVYMQESSHSSRDRRRSKSRSRGMDDRMKSSKNEQPSQSVVPTTLSSKIETVVEENSEKATEENSKNGKKHKKHHKKHRHSSSKSKKRHRSKDKEKKTIVDSTTSVIEVQS